MKVRKTILTSATKKKPLFLEQYEGLKRAGIDLPVLARRVKSEDVAPIHQTERAKKSFVDLNWKIVQHAKDHSQPRMPLRSTGTAGLSLTRLLLRLARHQTEEWLLAVSAAEVRVTDAKTRPHLRGRLHCRTAQKNTMIAFVIHLDRAAERRPVRERSSLDLGHLFDGHAMCARHQRE